MVPLDYHIHTRFSTDSQSEPEDLCRRAIELGLPEIGFSEHWDVGPYEEVTRFLQPVAWWQELTRLRRLYDQMPDPKWVVAMGNCTVSGGIFYYDTYSVVRGADTFLPVDVYLCGCPPRPESLQDAVLQLRELVRTESIAPGRRREHPLLLPEPESGGGGDGE